MTYPTLTYYAIESGREGDKPRTLHAFRDGSSTRTACDLPTDNCVSLISERDAFCDTCYPGEGD